MRRASSLLPLARSRRTRAAPVVPGRAEVEGAAVPREDRVALVGALAGEAGLGSADDVVEPDVGVALHLVHPPDRRPATVPRQGEAAEPGEIARRAELAEAVAGAVAPDEPAQVPLLSREEGDDARLARREDPVGEAAIEEKVFDEHLRLAREHEAFRVERLSHQGAVADEEEVPVRPDRVGRVVEQPPDRRGRAEPREHHSGATPRTEASRPVEVDEVLAVRQELREPVGTGSESPRVCRSTSRVSPPRSEIASSGPVAKGANRIVPLGLQVPPRASRAGASRATAPPSDGVVARWLHVKKPIFRPSGDQKGR